MAYATLKLGATLLLEELCKSVRWYLSPPLCAWAAEPRRSARANTVSNRELWATGIALRTNLQRLFIYSPLSLSFEFISRRRTQIGRQRLPESKSNHLVACFQNTDNFELRSGNVMPHRQSIGPYLL